MKCNRNRSPCQFNRNRWLRSRLNLEIFTLNHCALKGGYGGWFPPLSSFVMVMFQGRRFPGLCSDSVTQVNDATRVTICGDSDSTRVSLRKIVTGLDSSHVFHKMTRLDSSHSQWLETPVTVIFTVSLSSWWTNPVRLHAKKWAFCASVMVKIGANFLFCLSSCAMLHFKDQVSPTCVNVDLRLCFHWGISRAQYIDTLSWFNVVFAYRDHGSGPHAVTLNLFQIPVKCLKFSRFIFKPKTILQHIMQMRKPNLVYIQIPATVISPTPVAKW